METTINDILKHFILSIILLIFITSCTPRDYPTWTGSCPCTVYKIDKEITLEKIYIKSEGGRTLKFYTKTLNYYKIGDTIK